MLVLLIAGFLAGPVFGILQPDLVSDETLVSIVSLAVSVILFEGSLSLRLSELGDSAPTVWRLLAMSPVDEFNMLAVRHFATIFGRANVYQVAPDTEGRTRSGVSPRLTGRILFGYRWTFPTLSHAFEQGANVKVTCLTEEFGFEDFRRYYGDAAQVLFLLEPGGRLHVMAEDARLSPRAGHCLISLVLAGRGSVEPPAR